MFDQITIFSAQYLPIVIVAITAVFLVLLEKARRMLALALLMASSIIAFALDKILNRLVESPRPFMVEGVAPLFAHSTDNGFPSEHVLLAVVLASVVFAYNRKLGIILAVLGLIVGAARVIANVHHPIDIAGGAVIAISSVFIAHRLLSLPKVQSLLKYKITN